MGIPIRYILLIQHIVGLVAAGLLIVLIGVFLRKRRSLAISFPRAEAVFLTLLAVYPVFGYLLAYFVTKFIEARYILPALIGIAALIAIMMAPLLESKQ